MSQPEQKNQRAGLNGTATRVPECQADRGEQNDKSGGLPEGSGRGCVAHEVISVSVNTLCSGQSQLSVKFPEQGSGDQLSAGLTQWHLEAGPLLEVHLSVVRAGSPGICF